MAVQIRMERTHYGLRFTLPETVNDGALLTLLLRIPTKAYHLPQGEGIVLDFQGRTCSQEFLAKLLNSVVWGKGIRVLAWLSTDEEAMRLFRDSGLSVQEPQELTPPPLESPPPASEERGKGDNIKGPEAIRHLSTRFFYGSKRSGDRIETEGNVVLWGHLNPGAEIAAGGSVIVAGRLRGLVHAGQDGGEDAFILAGAFETPQIRLGHRISYADEDSLGWGKSVLITLGEEGTLDIRENTLLREEASGTFLSNLMRKN